MNIYLFRSSILNTILHVIYFYNKRGNLYSSILLIGCLTSLLNHYHTSNNLRLLDRIIMIILFCNDIIILTNKLKYYVIICGLLYLYSKKCNKVEYHILSHLILTYTHISVNFNPYLRFIS